MSAFKPIGNFCRFLSTFFNDLRWVFFRPSHWSNNVFGNGSDKRHLFDNQGVCKICNKLKEDTND
ncbi:MAG: hypothetical protein JNL74_06085 [Fibrobacteres bacterium]|nr:hypothetical protein [Fibrobacterota bacterium]